MTIKGIFSGAAALLLVGCSVFPKPAPVRASYYSIGEPERAIEVACRVGAITVTSQSCQRRQMMFKLSQDQCMFDNTNCWIDPPPVMVQRYLTLALGEAPGGDNELQLTAELLTFGCNLKRRQSTIALRLTLRRRGQVVCRRLCRATAKTAVNSAAGYAAAMHRAMTAVTADISRIVKSCR